MLTLGSIRREAGLGADHPDTVRSRQSFAALVAKLAF
jgi:hypothetical protein